MFSHFRLLVHLIHPICWLAFREMFVTCETWMVWDSCGLKPRHRLWALSWPWLLFTESSPLAHSARQTPRHRRASCKVLHVFSSLPSSVTSLKLCDFLLLFLSPNSIFGGNTAYSKSCSRKSLLRKTESVTRIHSLSACLINHLHFSSARTTHPVVRTFSLPSA